MGTLRLSCALVYHKLLSSARGLKMFLLPECHQPLAKRARPRRCYQWHCIGFAFGLCAAVLQCAPRARTKGRGMLRIGQSASKDVPATGQGQERFARIVTPFSAAGEAITREKHARSTTLSQATGCERLVAEALPLSQAIAVPPTRERSVVIAHLSPSAPVVCPFLEALCRVLCHCSALGARTGARTAKRFARGA